MIIQAIIVPYATLIAGTMGVTWVKQRLDAKDVHDTKKTSMS